MPAPADTSLELHCPWCLYELTGIDPRATCPECGKDTGPASRAAAAAQRVLREGKYRALFFASPALGILAGVGAFALIRDAALLIPATALACMSALGVFAVWRTQPDPERRRLIPALVLGPIMAVICLVWALATANVGITIIMTLMHLARGEVEFPRGYLWAFLPSLAIFAGGGWLIRRVLKT